MVTFRIAQERELSMIEPAAATTAARPAPAEGSEAGPGPEVEPGGADRDLPRDVARALLQFCTTGDVALLVVTADADAGPAVCRWANHAASGLLATASDGLEGRPVDEVVRPAGAEAGTVREWLRPQRSSRFGARAVAADGSERAVTVTAQPAGDGEGSTSSWTLRMVVDDDDYLTARLHASEQRFTALAEHCPIPTFLSEVGTRLAHVNDAYSDLVGTPAEDLLGTGWTRYIDPADLPDVIACIERTLGGEPADTPAHLTTAAGRRRIVHVRMAPITNPDRGAGFVGTVEDVTERTVRERELSHQARHDPLTGLPNRTQLFEQLSELMADSADPLAVLFVDLDDFKAVNDSLGHDTGDMLLIQIGERLRRATRASDMVVRVGGDEFVVVCPGVGDIGIAAEVAGRLLAGITAEVRVGDAVIRPSGSIGVALRSRSHRGPHDILRDADTAMYEAKSSGKDRFTVFDPAAHDAGSVDPGREPTSWAS